MNEIYLAYFASFSIVCGKTLPFIIEFLNRILKLTSRRVKSIVSWVVPVAIMYIGWVLGNFFDGSFLQELPAWKPAVYGAWAALLSNIEWNNVPWLKDAVNNFMDWLLKK